MTRQRCSITGFSCCSALGNTYQQLVTALKDHQTGLSKSHRFTKYTDSPLGECKVDGDFKEPDQRFAFLLNTMLEDISKRTELFYRYKTEDIGLFLGTTTAGIEYTIKKMYDFFGTAGHKDLRLTAMQFRNYGVVVNYLKKHFPIKGPVLVFSTACSASGVAIAEAKCAVETGMVKAALAGGLDILSPHTIVGFESLQLIDHDFCKPFATDRSGLNLSEGGGLLLLEKSQDNHQPVAYLVGAGQSNDIHHMTHPDPDGAGMKLAMQRALQSAEIEAHDIHYINAHGTGTLINDEIEQKAITQVFGDDVAMSSTKSLHGHALGGAGGIEAVVSLASLIEQQSWYTDSKPPVIKQVLSNSFGFGGNNVSLIFRWVND